MTNVQATKLDGYPWSDGNNLAYALDVQTADDVLHRRGILEGRFALGEVTQADM
jgi:hypothetical protein